MTKPIGSLYSFSFLDERGIHWEHTVVIPFMAGVKVAIDIVEKAYPNFVLKEVKYLMDVYHGYLSSPSVTDDPELKTLQKRNKALYLRKQGKSCCNRHADNMGCDCLS